MRAQIAAIYTDVFHMKHDGHVPQRRIAEVFDQPPVLSVNTAKTKRGRPEGRPLPKLT